MNGDDAVCASGLFIYITGIINGIINDALRKKICIDLIILDYRVCFDSLWIEEVINDLFETGVDNRNLALIYETNKVN